MYEAAGQITSCEVHKRRRKKEKPVTADKCDSTNDPVWEDDPVMVTKFVFFFCLFGVFQVSPFQNWNFLEIENGSDYRICLKREKH
jgi:hypothetical protein